MSTPQQPKIYRIVHCDRLQSIIDDGFMWCDAKLIHQTPRGTNIGMDEIKSRRLNELRLSTYPDLFVGQCVPFYFCPRSVMLYVISRRNHYGLEYRDGQEPIVHLEADLYDSVAWACQNQHRWAFTTSNAGSYEFEDYGNLDKLDKINWEAVDARSWAGGIEALETGRIFD